jgi:4-hydroxy-tetrahydrodipicolinate synthase
MTMHAKGPFVAIVTPIDGADKVDHAALERQVERQVAAGNGIFFAGTNGEFYALTIEEKIEVARRGAQAAAGRVPVMAHIGEVSTSATIALGRAVQDFGFTALSVVTPYFLACSQEELYRHYAAVADALELPIYLYNIPARTGNTIAVDTARRLAEHPNIVGVKDSAGSQESLDGYLVLARERDGFDVLTGPDSLIHHGYLNGAAGCISGLANLLPRTVNAIWTAHATGDEAAAARHQEKASELRKTLYALGYPPALVKRALWHVMPEVGPSRAPVLIAPEKDAEIKRIAEAFVER